MASVSTSLDDPCLAYISAASAHKLVPWQAGVGEKAAGAILWGSHQPCLQ